MTTAGTLGIVGSPQPAPGPESPSGAPQARILDPGVPRSDRIFRTSARGIGFIVLGIVGSIALFLALQAIPTFQRYGFSFLTTADWNPGRDHLGIAAVLVGTIEVASVAMVIAFPLGFAVAIFISEYAPAGLKSTLVSLVDLMAAVPSIIYGLWGRDLMQPHLAQVARFLHQNLGFIPIFKVDTDANAALWAQSRYSGSAFIAGVAVAMMVLPMAAAVMREVFSQTPTGEKEAALALGATRWDTVRTVVLPFGRGGIIGGTMLALGRALGETIAVVLIVSPVFVVRFKPLEIGANTISSLIAGRQPEATSNQLAALLTAGFVLFMITLAVNTLAARVVSRSRSGASTDL